MHKKKPSGGIEDLTILVTHTCRCFIGTENKYEFVLQTGAAY